MLEERLYTVHSKVNSNEYPLYGHGDGKSHLDSILWHAIYFRIPHSTNTTNTDLTNYTLPKSRHLIPVWYKIPHWRPNELDCDRGVNWYAGRPEVTVILKEEGSPKPPCFPLEYADRQTP